MFLFINTVDYTQLELGLFDFLEWKRRLKVKFNHKNDKILVLLEKLLRINRTKPEKLKGIVVLAGTGSFTGLRIILTIANTFGFLFDIPVVIVKSAEWSTLKQVVKKLMKKKGFVPLKPIYDKEPNITLPVKSW